MVDFLILGGGTSGAYLASRILDQNILYTVTIVEQGSGDFDDPKIRLSKNIGKVMNDPEYIRSIKTEEGDVAYGSVLGGGSSVNGGYVVPPSDGYLNTLEDSETWIHIRNNLKRIIPMEEKKAGIFMRSLNKKLNQVLTGDTFYTDRNERISSLSFLEKYRFNPRLNIISKSTVQSIKKIGDTFHVNTNGAILMSKNVIMCCGAATPEILMRSIDFKPAPVFNHVGIKLSLNKEISNTSGQIFFKGDKGYTTQILIYGKDVNIYNLDPDNGWKIMLASRGDMYYTDKQMSPTKRKEFEDHIEMIRSAIKEMGYSIVEEGVSMTYHMVGGCQHIVNNFEIKGLPGLYVADLSILPKIPDGNTSFMALMIAEKFVHDNL